MSLEIIADAVDHRSVPLNGPGFERECPHRTPDDLSLGAIPDAPVPGCVLVKHGEGIVEIVGRAIYLQVRMCEIPTR